MAATSTAPMRRLTSACCTGELQRRQPRQHAPPPRPAKPLRIRFVGGPADPAAHPHHPLCQTRTLRSKANVHHMHPGSTCPLTGPTQQQVPDYRPGADFWYDQVGSHQAVAVSPPLVPGPAKMWGHAGTRTTWFAPANPLGPSGNPQVHSDKHLTFEDCYEDWTLWGPAYKWGPLQCRAPTRSAPSDAHQVRAALAGCGWRVMGLACHSRFNSPCGACTPRFASPNPGSCMRGRAWPASRRGSAPAPSTTSP